MAETRAYSRNILPNGKDGMHSTAPAWVVTFVRWENRYLNIPEQNPSQADSSYFLSVRDPLVVENDCASVSVSYSKESHTPQMQAMFYAGDLNYLTAVAPGDFVMVNMLDFPEEARRVADKARAKQPINRVEDGFKGIFKVQSVRRVLAVDPATGTKRVMFTVSGYAFTELNNTLYFNPFLISQAEQNNQFLFVTRISKLWEQKVASKGGITDVQDILELIIDASIGIGFNREATEKKEVTVTPNTHFYVPESVGALLNVPGAQAAKDIYNFLFGVQEYISTNPRQTNLQRGFNPKIKAVKDRFYFTDQPVQGTILIKPEYWNQTSTWSILNQYANTPINELFTTLRVSPEGNVMPTVVLRQIPFSTGKYTGLSTKFMNLPRWRVSPDLLLDINIGRDEAARLNFIQVFASVQQASAQANQGYIVQQIAAGNFQADILDVQRSGLKPYIFTSNFDTIPQEKEASKAPQWAKLMADAVFGSHLKLNGSVKTFGIVEPIAVGDNLELDNVVYHIEGLSHACQLQPDGKRSFTTTLEISHGLDVKSEKGKKIFAQMDFVDMQGEIKNDRDKLNATLPGVSDEQSIVGRENPDTPGKNTTRNKAFKSDPGDPPSATEKRTVNPKGKGAKR